MNGSDILHYIKLYYKNKISFFPLFPSTKVPVVKHSEYYQRMPTKEEIKEWLKTYLNPQFWRKVWKEGGSLKDRWLDALRTEFNKIGRDVSEYEYEGEINIAIAGGYNGLTLIDIEDASQVAEDPVKFFSELGFVVIKTGKPNGYHLYCRSEWDKNVAGENGEIRVHNQYVVAPPSRHPNGSYYQLLTDFKLEEVSVSFIKKEVLKWIQVDTKPEKKKAGAELLWTAIKDAAKDLPVVHGKRSDWTFALTVAAKTLLRDEKKAFEELLDIPIVNSKVTRDGKWDTDRAYEWWIKYEWGECNPTNIYSLLHVIKWAEQTTGLRLPIDVQDLISNYLSVTREKGYGYMFKEPDIVLEITRILDSCLEIIETKNGEKVDVMPDYIHIIAEEINNMFYFAAIEELDELYIFRDGVYKPCEFWLKRLIQHAWNVSELRKHKPLTTQKVNEIISAIKRMNYTPLAKFYESARKYINVKNGLINLENWKLEPHRAEVLFLTQLNAEYDPNAEAEEWDEFLKKVTDEKYIPVLQEFCGYCLLADCRFEKALAIVGPGGSGKSTFLEVIRSVLGDENTTGFSIQQLESERFARAELIGKLANIYNDLPYDYLEKSDIFKQLVSGDPIQVERKYRQPFLARIYAKLIFSANQLPPTRDMSSAFFRRWIIVPFPNPIEKPDPTLKKKLTSNDRVRNYVLKWMIEGLKRLLEKGFSYELSTEEIAEFYMEAADSVFAFIEEHIVEDPQSQVEKDELYHKYIDFCKTKGYPAASNVGFAMKLRRYLNVTDKQIQKGGKRKRYWIGIRYVEERAEEESVKEDNGFDLEDLLG
jgi:putative DNA primase/helicase